MKKLFLSLVILILLVVPALAQQPVTVVTPGLKNSSQAQISCGTTAVLLYSGARQSITIENFTAATVSAYIGTQGITATTGGIQLTSALMSYYIDNSGQDDWYCITSSGTATIGVFVRK
jgi:hypothetical protein